uniref:Uncharacterized protein n=1 Tax=Zooxanthella nutricula TaxID=1333877 RepID=A0A6U9LSC2_9DINO|mmetsp:Transcript_17406/g.51933  ORF Transcript_17406/g.51933 Transcript_17406/m.51933 type:complete len:113 (+) Transcript_17406:119-457(+)|eukprot:CAMPEP_0198530382 /NCGR_PEP_ID=MMETSP1462-20131121/26319_1 /TAXON_ID=1333877 /ORGANISM="Brandtodinium nutriculum, Strain RCC3387" /LENGTH=112 /DNA_ID=CAMNT_0044260255 /DNA_START=17 /DNA_END=355 /DNA_ORIENTATION=-
MASAVGDLQELRKRKTAEAPAPKPQPVAAPASASDGDTGPSEYEKEYIDYFRNKYGENPRSDFLGIDGMALFCLIYIVIAGVVLSILYFSVYARAPREFFGGTSAKPGTAWK